MSRCALLVLVVAASSWAHDLSADVTSNLSNVSDTNPRPGSAGVSLGGTYDFSDVWSAWLGAAYTRTFATQTSDASSPGSNVFLLNAGATFAPNDHFMFSLLGTFSPQTTQDTATPVTVLRQGTKTRVNAVVHGTTSSEGGTLVASYSTAGESAFESTVDLSFGVNHYDAFQQLVLKPAAALIFDRVCGTSTASICPLVKGERTPLTQFRLGLTYTATLLDHFDVGLDGGYYLYDSDPTKVGFYTLVIAGRSGGELGSGVPVSPLLFSLRPSAAYRFEKLSFKLSYQYGQYVSSADSANTATGNHTVSVRAAWKVTRGWRVALLLSGQADSSPTGLTNLGLAATASVLWSM